jgi:plasmid stabilization system protein ParE
MKVVVTEAACLDLRRIGLTIAAHSHRRADTFVEELYDKCQDLQAMPFAFPLIRDRKSFGIRRRVHGNYLIFYRTSADTVESLHILHGTTDHDAILPDK